MLRREQDVACVAVFDEAPRVHDGDLVGDLGRDAEVVGHEDHRHAHLALDLAQQDQDLNLHGGIEGGRRLVGEQEARAARQRHGDHHALAQPAGQLVRIGLEPPLGRRHAHQLQQLQRAGQGCLPADALVAAHRLGDLAAHRVQRIERRHRLLEHHGHQGAAQPGHRTFAERADVVLRDVHRAFDHGPLLGVQAQQGPHHDRLARAGLPDHAQDLAALKVERNPVDRPDRRLPTDEPDAQFIDANERGRMRHGLRQVGRRHLIHRASPLPVRRLRPWRQARGCAPIPDGPCGRPPDAAWATA